ncbi:MAG: ATP-dependent helicase [Actinobacteria bacterium]|nr:ATP-dependent helicase [Actinomycetota bacterium]
MKEYRLKDLKNTKPADYKIDYDSELNPAQLEAVSVKNGPVLVIAGAGSGKTRTLVYRVARLVEEGVSPSRILLLTFTRKASQEMLRRASAILDKRCANVSGGTFHSFANQLLRRYSKYINFTANFTILDKKDSEDVVGFARNKLGYYKKEKRFPRKDTIADIISKSVNKDLDLQSIVRDEYSHFIDYCDEIKKIKDFYCQYKFSRTMMDYDDLLIYLEKLLFENDDIRKKISSFYKYIMIDEFQDTNKLQAKIAYLLASEHKNIMVVGDDSQSIYSFRGANFKNIMDFPKIYPRAKIIKLEQNYRSTQPILDYANRIMHNAKEKYEKNLFTKKEGTEKPVFIETENENFQSRFIVQRVLELREEGVALEDMAVLFRSSWQSMDLEIELNTHNIPYVIYGGIKFTEAAHIKDVLSILKISHNPKDSVSWSRTLMLLEGIGGKTATDIIEKIVDKDAGADYLIDNIHKNKKYETILLKLHELIYLINKPANQQSFAEKLHAALDFYMPVLKNKYDDYNKRQEDLSSLETVAARYKTLDDFLSDLTLEPIDESQFKITPEDAEDEKLILSTIHSAKGLEWHTVFIIFLIDGYLPSTYSINSSDQLEEERRLLYVASTRAKENLYLLKPQWGRFSGNFFDPSFIRFTEVSRFLKEGNILDDYVEKWALKE